MATKRVAIVGSGMAGAAFAYDLTRRGFEVDLFEKGPHYPYPHESQFWEIDVMQRPPSPELSAAADLKDHTFNGTWTSSLENERRMCIGGSATVWAAITLRMRPNDFKRRSLFGYGEDWPLTYDDLEPYYCRAESLIGVSGTDRDNPFAPTRSQPYPLPEFELAHDDRILADRLEQAGITLHTTPQARTRQPYGDREPCVNYGTCRYCPIGARYTPTYHLQKAQATGLCRVHEDSSVRRVLTDASGRARGVLVRDHRVQTDREHAADVVVVAAGTVETVRLLLLSKSRQHPEGLGNRTGHVGRNLTLHHVWHGGLRYRERLMPGRFGGWTGQSHQFLDPPQKGRMAGIKVELPSEAVRPGGLHTWHSAADVLEQMAQMPHTRTIKMHAESIGDPRKSIGLSERRDRFGDPLAHVEYWFNDLDHATFQYARELTDRFAAATRAEDHWFVGDPETFRTYGHQMGACRMAASAEHGVVDSYGRVFDVPGLMLAGNSIFVGASGPVNPTLTLLALAIRSSDLLATELGSDTG